MALQALVRPERLSSVYNPNNGNTETFGNIFLDVYDDNGQLANGNGLIVYYNERENGRYITQKSKTILGTSEQICTDILLDSIGTYQSYYFEVMIESYTQPSGVVYQGNGPTITEVRILLTAHGAEGGTVLIVANSSDGSGLDYMIDATNVNPRFSGLTAGPHVAKVRDQNGRQTEFNFNMPAHDEFLVGTPNKELITGSNINSRWHAAFNPLVFTYQRKDFRVIDVQNVNDNPCLYIREAVTGLKPKDMVYVDAGLYQGIFTVKNTTDTTVTLDMAFISNSNGATGLMNSDTLRPYFKVVSEITYTDPDTRLLKKSEYRHSPNPRNGIIEADYSGILRSLVMPFSKSLYNELNHNDPYLCAAYSVRYREEWQDGPAEGRWFQIPGNFYVTYSAMQVQSTWGSNMGKFVPFIQGSRALFVTDFKEPAYTPGYPFDIGFIYSEIMYDIPYYLHITLLDVNRKPMGDPIIHRLEKKVGLNRLLLSQNTYHDNCWYLRLKIYGDNNGPVQVTKDKVVRIDRTIDVNSVYVRWVGYAGSWEYYRFVWNQEMSLNVQNAVTVKRYIYDYENTEGAEDTISKEAATGIKVFAEDLPVADIRGLQSLKTSPKVQWLASRNPMRWQTVIVATGSAVEYETQMGTYAYQLQFTLPGVVVQTL